MNWKEGQNFFLGIEDVRFFNSESESECDIRAQERQAYVVYDVLTFVHT